MLYGDHGEEQILADAADVDTEIGQNQEGDEPPPEIATAPEISVPEEAGKTLENKSLASVKRRYPLRHDARNKTEENDKSAEFSELKNSDIERSDDYIESDKDSLYSEYESYVTKERTKRMRCNKSSSTVSTRLGSEQARNAYIRALQTYPHARVRKSSN